MRSMLQHALFHHSIWFMKMACDSQCLARQQLLSLADA